MDRGTGGVSFPSAPLGAGGRWALRLVVSREAWLVVGQIVWLSQHNFMPVGHRGASPSSPTVQATSTSPAQLVGRSTALERRTGQVSAQHFVDDAVLVGEFLAGASAQATSTSPALSVGRTALDRQFFERIHKSPRNDGRLVIVRVSAHYFVDDAGLNSEFLVEVD